LKKMQNASSFAEASADKECRIKKRDPLSRIAGCR